MEPTAGAFSEEQFREACAELQRPALSGAPWELLVETQGISVYRLLDQVAVRPWRTAGRPSAGSGLGVLPGDVHSFPSFQGHLQPLGSMNWQALYPCSYVYTRQRRELDFEGQKVHVILAQSTSEPQIPEKPGVIRVKQYKQRLAIQSDGKRGSKVFMYYFDNPGGQIPSWVINWAAKNGVPNFLKDMVKACQNYKKT
uniref:Phosphatidylcholine transfer protein n=1 Tax=Moschus moschiferus TaxID=68415 RepID=A0A8C6DN47_MOSMO